MFPTVGRSRERRTVDNSSETQDDLTQTVLRATTKSMLPTPIRRNPIRSPLQCVRCTNVATGLWCHIPRDPNYRMVLKLFGRSQWHNPTRQGVGVRNRKDQRSSHPIAKWQYYHPTPSPTCTHVEKEPGLHWYANRSRVQEVIGRLSMSQHG